MRSKFSSDFGKLWFGLVKGNMEKVVKVASVLTFARASPRQWDSTAGADPGWLVFAGLNSTPLFVVRFLRPE